MLKTCKLFLMILPVFVSAGTIALAAESSGTQETFPRYEHEIRLLDADQILKLKHADRVEYFHALQAVLIALDKPYVDEAESLSKGVTMLERLWQSLAVAEAIAAGRGLIAEGVPCNHTGYQTGAYWHLDKVENHWYCGYSPRERREMAAAKSFNPTRPLDQFTQRIECGDGAVKSGSKCDPIPYLPGPNNKEFCVKTGSHSTKDYCAVEFDKLYKDNPAALEAAVRRYLSTQGKSIAQLQLEINAKYNSMYEEYQKGQGKLHPTQMTALYETLNRMFQVIQVVDKIKKEPLAQPASLPVCEERVITVASNMVVNPKTRKAEPCVNSSGINNSRDSSPIGCNLFLNETFREAAARKKYSPGMRFDASVDTAVPMKWWDGKQFIQRLCGNHDIIGRQIDKCNGWIGQSRADAYREGTGHTYVPGSNQYNNDTADNHSPKYDNWPKTYPFSFQARACQNGMYIDAGKPYQKMVSGSVNTSYVVPNPDGSSYQQEQSTGGG